MRFRFWRKKKYIFVFIAVIGVITFFSCSYFDDALMLYVKNRTTEYFEKTVNKTIKEDVVESLDGNLMQLVYTDDGKIAYSYLDTKKVNQIKNLSSSKMEELINCMNDQDGFKSVSLPFGYFFTRKIYLTDGFKLPVNLTTYTAHDTAISTVVKSYGVNSSILEIYLDISLDLLVSVPFQSDKITCCSNILLSCEVTHSEVPEFYFVGSEQVPYIQGTSSSSNQTSESN